MRRHDAAGSGDIKAVADTAGAARADSGKATPPAGTTLPFSAPRDVRNQLTLAVHQLNSGSIRSGMHLRFAVDYTANPATVRVTDANSGELVRSIPWTELLPELNLIPVAADG